jgi:putative flippase GtrA
VARRREFAFLVVGGANTVFSLAVFATLHATLGDRAPYLVLLVLTYAIGIVVSFVSQRVLVFRVQGRALGDFVRFAAVQVLAFALNALLLAAIVEIVGMPVVPAQAVALATVVVVTYFSHLHFSFRRPRPTGQRVATATTEEPKGRLRPPSSR